MSESVYKQLALLLDTIPNGYPATDTGVELKILESIFTEEEAAITLQLKLKYETPEQIAERKGMDAEYLKNKLHTMYENGLIWGAVIGPVRLYKLLPFVFGIYEFQVNRLTPDLVELIEDYFTNYFGKIFFSNGPALMKVVPINQTIPDPSTVEPYQSVTALVNSAKAWAVGDCVCKKEKMISGHKCSKPMEVCLALAPLENYFDTYWWGRPISKDEAMSIIKTAEDAGLVHMTSNVKSGHIYICNCCDCCCGILNGLNKLNNPAAVAKSNYTAVVDESLCTSCGICLDRCQVSAITMDSSAEINSRCIGCGLCVTTCPVEAIVMKRKTENEIENVPKNENEWLKMREEGRSGSFEYKKLI
jgi:Na+-translocating ferredoxin:NAD+ oxidoreductase RNF subunit RnfB